MSRFHIPGDPSAACSRATPSKDKATPTVRPATDTGNKPERLCFGDTYLFHPHVRGHHLILLILKSKSNIFVGG